MASWLDDFIGKLIAVESVDLPLMGRINFRAGSGVAITSQVVEGGTNEATTLNLTIAADLVEGGAVENDLIAWGADGALASTGIQAVGGTIDTQAVYLGNDPLTPFVVNDTELLTTIEVRNHTTGLRAGKLHHFRVQPYSSHRDLFPTRIVSGAIGTTVEFSLDTDDDGEDYPPTSDVNVYDVFLDHRVSLGLRAVARFRITVWDNGGSWSWTVSALDELVGAATAYSWDDAVFTVSTDAGSVYLEIDTDVIAAASGGIYEDNAFRVWITSEGYRDANEGI